MGTKKEAVFNYCKGKDNYFSLSEAYEALGWINYPTIRYYIQCARDAGIVEFVDYNGLYKVI